MVKAKVYDDDPFDEFVQCLKTDPVILTVAILPWLNYDNQEKAFVLREILRASNVAYAFTPYGVWLRYTKLTIQSKSQEFWFIRLKPRFHKPKAFQVKLKN